MSIGDLIFGSSGLAVNMVDFAPVQTKGEEADARRKAMMAKRDAAVKYLGPRYRLYLPPKTDFIEQFSPTVASISRKRAYRGR